MNRTLDDIDILGSPIRMVFNAHTLEVPDFVKYLLLSFSYWILFRKVREMVEAHDVLVDAEKLNAFCRLALLPDGLRFVSGSNDTTARIVEIGPLP